MAGKYLDLEIKYLREDLEREVKWLNKYLELLEKGLDCLNEGLEREIEWLKEDLGFIREDIKQIQDLLGIERKDGLTLEEFVRFDIRLAETKLEQLREELRNGDDSKKVFAEKLEEEIKKYKEQNKLH